VTSVAPGSPAQACGLRVGDALVALGDQPVTRGLDCHRLFLGRQPGDEVPMTVVRRGEEVNMGLVLSEPDVALPSIADKAWQLLGVRLTLAPVQSVRQLSSRYRGGMRVTAVRPNSPAAREGIRSGDILVGLHKWETTSLDNIAYILESREFAEAQPAKFYILRGTETLYGQLTVPDRATIRY
jgi:serine protease Do